MTKDQDFKLLKIQTCVLKVNIHCDGCKQKVKKLLQRIEGVYTVNMDAEQQKVTVSGSVDSATLVKKLVKSGKHAELWSTKSNQNQKQQQPNCVKVDNNSSKNQKQGLMSGLKAFKNQHKLPTFGSEEDEDDCYDDDEYDDEEDDLRFLREKVNHLGLLRQQANEANNVKKTVAAANIGKMNNAGNGNAGKKGGDGGGNPNQIMGGMKGNPGGGGIDQKTMAALKMNNAHFGGGGNPNSGEAKRGNDLNTMMNLAGFHGGGGGGGGGVGLGGGNGLGGLHQQVQPSFQAGGFPTSQQHASPMMMTNMHGYQYNQHPSSMMLNMNMQNRHAIDNNMMNDSRYMQQPQMTYYNRSPLNPPNTGYYYNNYSPSPQYPYSNPHGHGDHSASSSQMFNDENTDSCAIM